MSNQLLFQVTNHHGEASGIPPQIDEQTFPGVYRSYFENQNGEQAVFLYDYEQARAKSKRHSICLSAFVRGQRLRREVS